MNNRFKHKALIIVGLLALFAAGYYWLSSPSAQQGKSDHKHGPTQTAATQLWTCGMHPQVIQDKPGTCPICHMKLTPLSVDNASGKSAKHERKIKYWWDPMLGPSSISDKPGKSAMGMDLVPVYEDDVLAGSSVTIDPVVVQNMGVRVDTAVRGPFTRTIRAVGYLTEAEPKVHDINLRVSGWIEKLYANTEGQEVKEGDPLFTLYSPELQVAVEELLATGKAVPTRGDALSQRNSELMVLSARRKLERWGIEPKQIEKLMELKQAPRSVPFNSPVTGHVTQKNVVEGAAVTAGTRILRIVDHSTLWLDVQVFEQDLSLVNMGQPVEATFESLPGVTIQGKIIFIHPHINPESRTATVRMTVPNDQMTLRPGMYGTASILIKAAEDATLVPREAVIDTGVRKLLFVSLEHGRFDPRIVKTGAITGDGMIEITEGVLSGDRVVTSGQFLLDAESRMREAIQKHLDSKLLVKPVGTSDSSGAEGHR